MGLNREQEEERIWRELSPDLISQGINFLPTMGIYGRKDHTAHGTTTTEQGCQQGEATQQETTTMRTRKKGWEETGADPRKITLGNLTNNSKASQTGDGEKGKEEP